MDYSSLNCFVTGKLVLSSGLLQYLWSKISGSPSNSSFRFETYHEPKYTLVVFDAQSIYTNSSASVSTLLLQSDPENPFPFLFSEKKTSFRVHETAYNLFTSAKESLTDLKSKLLESLKCKKKPVIITGAGLGGTVASLFTLWLLETINPKLKRPLCVTFGSPLIGDASLQQILENSVRNSCFLHVAEAAQTRINSDLFKPFGTFLICFASECICIEDSDAVIKLLLNDNVDVTVDYGQVLHRLDQTMLAMSDSRLIPDDVIQGMKKNAEEKKKYRFDMDKKLKDMKISMAYMEWYKKECKKDKSGYYDRFKNQTASPSSQLDIKIKSDKIELNKYWKAVVEEVEKKPQSDISILTRRYLFSGNNYRRMVEPLDIAEYYAEGGREYQTLGRSRQYVMLDKWFGMELIEKERCKYRDLTDLLTFDSCFWAEVEESLIVISLLRTAVGMRDDERKLLAGKLVKFEEYVWGLIQEREVSPEIFLEKSSFMKWWREYREIKGYYNSPPSDFTDYMNTWEYESYGLSQSQ